MDPSPALTPTPAPKLLLGPLLAAVSDVPRWRILAELSKGEPLMVKELAVKIGRTPDATSKLLTILRRAGVVVIGRGGLYQIPSTFLVAPQQLDFGHCLLRMNQPE